MRLLVINPNSSETVTAAIMESAHRGAEDGTELIGITTKGGTRNIDSAFGDYLSGTFVIRTCLEAVKLHRPDALVLAGFGRVGIDALKEALEIPVVSISEASMAIACLLGHRFTTLTMLEQFIPYQQDLVRLYGFETKCASVRAINVNVEECVTNRAEMLRQLKAQIQNSLRTYNIFDVSALRPAFPTTPAVSDLPFDLSSAFVGFPRPTFRALGSRILLKNPACFFVARIVKHP